MRRLLLALSLLAACDQQGKPPTDREVCGEAFDCVLDSCEWPAEDAQALIDSKPDCSGLDGGDLEQCSDEAEAWADDWNAIAESYAACAFACIGASVDDVVDPAQPDVAGMGDGMQCGRSEADPNPHPEACEAPRCDQF